MRKFVENWKIKYALFNKKDRMKFKSLTVMILPSLIGSGFFLNSLIPEKYLVTYEYRMPNGIVEIVEESVKENTTIKLPVVRTTYDDYEFIGWQTKDRFNNDSNSFSSTFVINKDAVFITKWGEVRYERTYETETLNYETKEKKDATLEIGTEVVETEGKDGKVDYQYETKYLNNKKVEKVLIKEDRKDPIDKVILVGIKKPEVVQYNTFASVDTSNKTSTTKPVEKKKEDKPPQKSEPKKESQPAKKPDPKPEKKPDPKPSYVPIYGVEIIPNKYNDVFKNCSQMQEVYPGGVPKGHPAYANYPGGDRDKDGWACEVKGISPDEFTH